MKKKLFSILLFITLIIPAYSQISEYTMEAELPSEQTYKQIEQMSGNPNLRAAPPGEDGDGGAQKMPIGKSDIMHLSILGLACVYYKIHRNRKTIKQN